MQHKLAGLPLGIFLEHSTYYPGKTEDPMVLGQTRRSREEKWTPTAFLLYYLRFSIVVSRTLLHITRRPEALREAVRFLENGADGRDIDMNSWAYPACAQRGIQRTRAVCGVR